MTKEEMIKRIEKLETENRKLKMKNRNTVPNIVGSMSAQKELDFIFPYFSTYPIKEWRRSTVGNFLHLRKLAMSIVDKVDENNNFFRTKSKRTFRKRF